MASPVALTIESSDKSDRAGLGSSFGSQRSYGTVKQSSASLTAAGGLRGYTEHAVHEEDTLQGLAIQYGVTVSECAIGHALSEEKYFNMGTLCAA